MNAKHRRLTLDELDAAIAAAEIEVVQRDRGMQRHAHLLAQELRTHTRRIAERAARWGMVSVGVLAFATLVLRGRRRHQAKARPRPEFRERTREAARQAPAHWVQVLPLVWPWLPRDWQTRVPAPAATVIAGWLATLLSLRRGGGRTGDG